MVARSVKTVLSCIFLWLVSAQDLWSQCNTLRPQIDINFNTDQDCAPVRVTEFRITYYFNQPQDPATIQILYEWNDPLNSVDVVHTGNGLVASADNLSFTANATFLYTENDNQCNITPTSYIVINGALCQSSEQVQTAFYWDTDNEGNGVVEMSPTQWEVCYDNPVVNAVFADASEFNCNINVEPDNPNQFARHVQFVYGTGHNPAATIRNLTLDDGAVQNLTNADGTLSTTDTRGTGAVQVTAAYFGPVDAIPFPADGPISVTYPMNAPADAANAVGNRFEISLFNWNVCNPWNGDPVNPNYEDAVITTGYIVIVPSPEPAFFTEDENGDAASDFCIGETVSFRNTTPDIASYSYTWQFYDDAAGTDLIGSANQRHPDFVFSSGGQKMIRLIATNPTAQAPCVEEFISFVNITPSMVAVIGVTDLNGSPITPDFCQKAESPFDTFIARFSDESTGTPTPNTVRRWEFYDENNTMVFESPAGGGFAAGVAGPFDRTFVNRGVYRVRLRIQDNVTGCESMDEKTVRVFEQPVAAFSFTRVCETFGTEFSDLSSLTSILGEQIVSWEWDMSYDGVTFMKDPSLDNKRNFSYVFPSAGNYEVALRVVADQGGCGDLISQSVIVDALPGAAFSADRVSGCSALQINFTNNAINGQPDEIAEYRWEIDDGSGFVLDSVQKPSDAGFSSLFTREFVNHGTADTDYQIRLRVITVNGCERVSPAQTITVYPSPRAGFVSLDYSPFDTNCSPVSVSFSVDEQTQAMDPTDYSWTVSDRTGVISQTSTGTVPAYDHVFVNDTQALQDFFVTLSASLASGCSGDSTRVIRVSPVPGSDFTIDTVDVTCERITLNFSAIQKGLQEYEWTIISNGNTLLNSTSVGDDFEFDIVRSPSVVQDVEIRLVTQNFAGCSSDVTSSGLTVGTQEEISPSFSASPSRQKFPDATVTITNATNAGPWQYRWDFGDGSGSTEASVAEHTYSSPGIYTITLTVSGEYCAETATAVVEIDPATPVLAFAYDPPSGCAPLTVTFTDQSQHTKPSTYHWDFGDGEEASGEVNTVHTYEQPGVYTVTLTAANEDGESAQLTKEFIIEVYETPTARFNIKPRQIPFPGGKLYTDNQSFGATVFLWDFGDGMTSTEFEPEHVYQAEGTYTISLTASNSAGCSDTKVLEAGAQTILSGDVLIPNAFSPSLSGPGNSGGQNDMFLPVLRGVTEFQMLVFNRWGELLFETTSAEHGWDGYYKGRLCQQDVYVYKITAKYSNGQTITRVGDIHLMR